MTTDAEGHRAPFRRLRGRRATRGVLARCEPDGPWHCAACPAGEVCEDAACVDNQALIVIAVESPGLASGPGLGALPVPLEDDMLAKLCGDSPACCESFTEALATQLDEVGAAAAKYWVRRVVEDLSEAHAGFTLLGPPTADGEDTFEPQCSDELEREADPCIGGGRPLMSPARAQALYRQLPVANATSPEIGLPAWDLDGATSPALDVLMAATIKGARCLLPG